MLSAFLYAQPLNAAIIAGSGSGRYRPSLSVVGGAISLAGVVAVGYGGRGGGPVPAGEAVLEGGDG